MATAVIYANKEHSIAQTSGALNVGTSNENHAPVGEGNSGWDWKELIRFPMTVSDFNGITQITSAVLRIKTTSGNHCSNDSGTCRVRGLNGSFAATGGGASDASDSWKTNADPVWPVSAIGTTGDLGSRTGGWADDTVYDIDITDYIEKYAPAAILKRGGSPCDDATNYGMVVDMDGASGISMEFKTLRGSYTPRIIVTGTTTPVPAAPTGLTPSGALDEAPVEGDFEWSGDAADESPLTAWDFIIEDTDTYTKGISLSNQTTGISGVDVASPTLTGLAAEMTRGFNYRWRVRHKNSEGVYGDWSAYQTFYINEVPDAPTWVNPTVAKPYALIGNLDATTVWTGSGDEAKPLLSFQYNHPDGLACTGITIEVDAVEDPLILTTTYEDGETITVQGHAQGRGSGAAVDYRIKVQDQNGNWSDWSTTVAVVTQWAQGIFNYNHGSGAGDFVHNYSLASGEVAFLYRKADGTPGSWVTSIGDVSPSTHLDILVRLATDNGATNAVLTNMSLEYVATGSLPPDLWTCDWGGPMTLDASRRRFGRRSAKVASHVSAAYIYPDYGGDDPYLIVTPGEEYTWSVYIFAAAAAVGNLRIHDGGDTYLEQVAWSHDGDSTWQRFSHTFTVPEGTTRIKPIIRVSASQPDIWLDSAQFEEGSLTTQWKPGGIGPAVSIDVGGLQIDAQAGGIFRLLSDDGAQVVQMEEALTFRRVADASEVKVSNVGSQLYVDSDLDVNGDITADNIYTPAASLVQRTIYETSGTWNKPSEANFWYATIEAIGGGGGGGGADNTSSTEGASGGGGGAGGYVQRIIGASSLPSSLTVTIGGGASGGSNAGGDGSNGGDTTVTGTSFTTMTAGGGGGGSGDVGGTGRTAINGGAAGSAAGDTGDLLVAGQPGQNGERISLGGVASATGIGIGRGGDSRLGHGGRTATSGSAYGTVGYGAGGHGSWNHNSGAAATGGDGGDGIVIITEFYLPIVGA